MSEVSADLVVAGGGLVGLTLAIACAGAGLEVVVVDREDPAAKLGAPYDGRASAIAFGSQRALAATGVWPLLYREAEPILEIRVADDSAPLFLHYDHKEAGDDPFGWIVENRAVRRALFERAMSLATLRLLAPVSLARLERLPGRAEAHLSDGRVVRAPLCAAADGKDSPLRKAAGIGAVAWTYKQTGIVCTVRHKQPHHGIAVEHFLPAGPFAILPMTGNRSSIVWTEKAALAPRYMRLAEDGFRAELARRFGDFRGELRVEGPRWSYELALMHAKTYVAPRLALVGDAAHAIHPIAGQGLNLGLRDVAALAETIVDARRLGLDIGGLDVLRGYERWRRFDNTALAAVTDGLNRLFSNDIAPVKWARGLGLAAVDRMPPLKRVFMRHAMGTFGDLPRLIRGEKL